MTWTGGWWESARKVHLHAARMGGAILPIASVVHATAMHPDAWDDLLRAWATSPGKGNAAHFAIGFSEVVQFVPVTRNANHAGGSSHGVFKVGHAALHPNLVTVGIEVHNAVNLRHLDGAWRMGQAVGPGKVWTPQGRAFEDSEVEQDPLRPERGWHKPTAYQLDMLTRLLDDLEQVLQPLPAHTVVQSGGNSKVPTWGQARTPRRVGHVTLDPDRRSDPGPIIMRHLNR